MRIGGLYMGLKTNNITIEQSSKQEKEQGWLSEQQEEQQQEQPSEQQDQSSKIWILIDDDDKPICNFIPKVCAWVDVHTNDKVIPHVRLRLSFRDGEDKDGEGDKDKKGKKDSSNIKPSEEFLIPISELGRIDWTEKDIRCRFHLNYPRKRAKQYLEDRIRTTLASEDIKRENKYILTKLGIHNIENTMIYCAGSLFIQASGVSCITGADSGMHGAEAGICDLESDVSYTKDSLDIELGSFSQRLAIDLDLYSEKDCFDGMIKLIKLSPKVGRVLHAHAITGIMRSVYLKARIAPCAVLQAVGKTGMFKTTYTSFLTQLYNRDIDIRPATRLNATKPFIEKLLHENADCIVVLDDIHPAEDRDIVRKNEATLEEMTRRIGDITGRGHMKGNKKVEQPPNCNVITTGEYIYGKGSTAARMLTVDFIDTIDSVGLQECQNEPLLVSTFYYYFIKWYVSNYHGIKELVKKSLDDFRSRVSLADIHKRLNESYFCLNTGFALFLKYCEDKGFMSGEAAKDTLLSFQRQLVDLVYRQNDIHESNDGIGGMASNTCMVGIIRQLYKGNKFHLAESRNSFVEGVHDGLIHNKCLCLRSKKLEAKIQLFAPNARIEDIKAELRYKGALISGTNGDTKQIYSKNVDGKGTGGRRFFFIPLVKLR